MSRLPRMASILLLAAILATTAVVAEPLSRVQPRRTAVAAPAPMNLATRLWSFLSWVWSEGGRQPDPNGRWSKNGCNVDPNGQCLTAPTSAATTGDNGCHVDPDGVCIW